MRYKRVMASLITIKGPTPGQRFALAGGCMLIGRQADADIRLADRATSRRHARILHEEGAYYVEDLGSSNGTWLNGIRISEREPLTEGDMLQIGPYIFNLRPDRPAGGSGKDTGDNPFEAQHTIRAQVDVLSSSNQSLYAQNPAHKPCVVLKPENIGEGLFPPWCEVQRLDIDSPRMQTVEIYKLLDPNGKVVGRFVWDGGAITPDPADSVLLLNILEFPIFDHANRKTVSPKEDPQAWMANLYLNLRGTYLWAGEAETIEAKLIVAGSEHIGIIQFGDYLISRATDRPDWIIKTKDPDLCLRAAVAKWGVRWVVGPDGTWGVPVPEKVPFPLEPYEMPDGELVYRLKGEKKHQ
jgi:hypothetical protein